MGTTSLPEKVLSKYSHVLISFNFHRETINIETKMARVILLLCALLIGTLISQGEGCKPPKWVRVGGKWIKRVAGREVTFGDREGYKLNYSEMLDGIKHPGLMSALKAYDTNKDGIISGEGKKWER